VPWHCDDLDRGIAHRDLHPFVARLIALRFAASVVSRLLDSIPIFLAVDEVDAGNRILQTTAPQLANVKHDGKVVDVMALASKNAFSTCSTA
jgi:hypothetical protein